MGIPYDTFVGAFLAKITEFDLLTLADDQREEIIDGYLKHAVSAFRKNCKYDLFTTGDDENRLFDVEVNDDDLDELVEIISEGMVVQWLKPFLYKQEILENVLNTKDFTTYSPAELLLRVGNAYKQAKADYTNMIREYSYNHGDLSELHI